MGHIDQVLYRIADDIDRHGIRRVEDDVAAVVDRARAVGLAGPVLDVLADTREPAIARARAFGMVACRVVHRERTPKALAV